MHEKQVGGNFVKRFFGRIPKACLVLFALGILALIVHIISYISSAFADFFTRYIGSAVRFILTKITGWIPFSLAEMIIILVPIIFAVLMIVGMKTAKSPDKNAYIRFLCVLLAIVSTLYSLFVFTIGTAYRGSTLYEKLGVEKPEYENSEDLVALSGYLRDKANECAENISFSPEYGSVMPYSRGELNDLLNDACIKASEKYSFLAPLRSRFKDIALSEPMTYTHISGVYTYFTGESNINTNFPDYTIPFTAAHEMAHQRGIAREEEANFVAYLICMESDDNYVKYSAYVSLLEYVQSALYKADKSAYAEFYPTLGEKIVMEYEVYDNFFAKYRKSVASDVSGTINNVYLQSQGQKAGSMSYSLVVGLAIAYIDY
ncbi:MAG: DUF3810 domain-containing protein [Ruminococcaceae bacterium]|nr:DUF3810 domain-containing protein [Oscillospiraceae bacterium]